MSKKSTDRYSLTGVRGEIRARWTRGMDGVETSYPVLEVHNTLSYAAADVLAEAYGGDDSRIPKYIGFIYGPQLQSSEGDAPAALPPITRDMDLQSIDNMCRSFGLNMQVVRFSRRPTVGDYATFGMDIDKEPQYKLVPIYDGEGSYTDWICNPDEIEGNPIHVFYESGYWNLDVDGVGMVEYVNGSITDTNILFSESGVSATREYIPPKIIGYKRVPVDPDDSNDSNDEYENPYVNNVVEFHAVTRSGRDGVYHGDTDESSPYAGPLDKNMYLYRAVLLGDGRNPCEDPYTVLAMADLKKNGEYRQKPASYELALDWRVTFE